jgi:predicted enzyme related to lactoylglutathione lyase
MSIDGVLVADLIRALESRAQLVLYARNLARMKAFYQGVFRLQVEHSELDTALKPVFDVESIAAARDSAFKLRGGIDAVEREWTFRGRRLCNGHDPEGNVLQLRQRGRDGTGVRPCARD